VDLETAMEMDVYRGYRARLSAHCNNRDMISEEAGDICYVYLTNLPHTILSEERGLCRSLLMYLIPCEKMNY